MNTIKTDTLIIGGGIIGLASAYYLLEAGRTVRILEMGTMGSGSSHGNCGLVTPSHAPPLALPGMTRRAIRWMFDSRSPFYIKPTLRPSTVRWFLRFAGRTNSRDMLASIRGRGAILNSSRALYDTLVEANRLQCEWEDRGLIMVYKSAKEMHAFDEIEAILRDHDLVSTSYYGKELLELEPALHPGVYGGRFYEMDAHLRPDRLVSEMARVVVAKGAVLHENAPVIGIEKQGDRVSGVVTESGTYAAENYVMATGAWSPLLARQVGVSIPIQPGKGYTVTLPRPDPCPTYPLILKEANVAVTPWASGYRIGGTMEFSGYSEGLDSNRIDAILQGVGGYLGNSGTQGERESWYGWRPMTSDGMPYIGRVPRTPNLLVAAGHGMLGVSMAPGTGKLVSELITGQEPHIDPSPYALERG